MYICSHCGRTRDADFDVCSMDPTNPMKLICENCTTDADDEASA